MAFDLVQYFAEQIHIQKPELFQQYPASQRLSYIEELNVLSFGKLISVWQADHEQIFQEINSQDELYILEVSRHLTTSKNNQSRIPKYELEPALAEILRVQLAELKQLQDTSHLGILGFRELLGGQIEHLRGRAPDWVWSTNRLIELIGSKPISQDKLSLSPTMKEFQQMAHDHHEIEVEVLPVPAWSKIVEPIVAILVLWILACAASNIFA